MVDEEEMVAVGRAATARFVLVWEASLSLNITNIQTATCDCSQRLMSNKSTRLAAAWWMSGATSTMLLPATELCGHSAFEPDAGRLLCFFALPPARNPRKHLQHQPQPHQASQQLQASRDSLRVRVNARYTQHGALLPARRAGTAL